MTIPHELLRGPLGRDKGAPILGAGVVLLRFVYLVIPMHVLCGCKCECACTYFSFPWQLLLSSGYRMAFRSLVVNLVMNLVVNWVMCWVACTERQGWSTNTRGGRDVLFECTTRASRQAGASASSLFVHVHVNGHTRSLGVLWFAGVRGDVCEENVCSSRCLRYCSLPSTPLLHKEHHVTSDSLSFGVLRLCLNGHVLS